MITLHESNITSFPHDNGIGVLKDVIRAYAEEELNGLFEFYMEYDSEGHLVDELKEERIIKAKAQDKLGYQLFRIYSITKNHENDNLIVRAQHITYDLADNFVESLVANNLTKKQVMELIGSSTVLPHPFNITSSNTTTRSSTRLYRTNPLQMIGGIEGSVLQIWGGQIERDNFNLILHDRRGSDDGVKVTYEKNITGLEATFDISNLVTRIFPFVFVEGSDNEPDRLITVSGKYIDSPHINDYEKIYIRPIDYTHDERIDLNGTDAQIRQQLTNIASQYFTETGNDKIKVDMEVQFEHLWETEEYKDLAVLELVGIGDTVTIEHSRLKVDATAIVNYIRYDCIAEKNEEVRLGSVKARLTDNVNKTLDVVEKVEQAQQTANQAIRTANGKNTIYYGPDEPMTGQLGDLWFRVVDGEYTRTYRHDGIQWQLVLSVDVRDAIDEAQQAKDEAQQAVERANQATQQATNAINQAQIAFDEAQQALGIAGNAYDIATTLQGDVVNLSTLVDDNTGQISSITQSVTGLQTQVSDIEGNVSTLTQTVSSLTTRIGDAEGNITTLQQTSSSLAARLTDAEGNITTLTTTVNGLQTTVSNVQGDVSNVTQLANALQTRMTNAEGDISTLTQAADNLQTQIANLDDDVQSQFTQLSDAINLRVQKGDVINQINISDESILIDGKRIHITGQTKIDNGVIKSAHIESLDGGKITAGSIDAGKLNVTELSAISGNLGTVTAGRIETLEIAGVNNPAIYFESKSNPKGLIDYNDNAMRFQRDLWTYYRVNEGGSTGSAGVNPKFLHQFYAAGEAIFNFGIVGSHTTLTSKNALLKFSSITNLVQVRDNYDNGFADLQADNLIAKQLHSNEIRGTSGNLYLRPAAGGSVQAMTATGVYIPITASSVNANSVFTQNVEARNQDDVFVRPTNSGGLYVRSRGSGTPYRPVYASAFNEASSRDYKTNIEKYNESALEVINDLTVVTYNLKDDLENGILEKKIGFISEDSPAIATADGKAIQTYQLSAYNTKAIQELDSKFKNIEDKVNWLEIENQYLKQKVKQLEEMIA